MLLSNLRGLINFLMSHVMGYFPQLLLLVFPFVCLSSLNEACGHQTLIMMVDVLNFGLIGLIKFLKGFPI